MSALEEGGAGRRLETPDANEPFFRRVSHHFIASNAQALKAAAKKKHGLGYEVEKWPVAA